MSSKDEDQQLEKIATRVSALGFIRLAKGFWRGDDAKRAWLLTGGLFALLLCNLAVVVGLNRWNRWFFDALEKRDATALFNTAMLLVVLIVVGASFAVAMVKVKMTLQLRWRRWITDQLLTKWLSEQRYYKLALSEGAATSPEARITDDVRLATEPVVECVTGLVNATLSAVTFVGVLFVVGGSIDFGGWTIPGYIAIAAVLYALVVSATTFYIGQPLSAAVDRRSEAEAQFRYGLTRIRENVESVALIRGDEDELRRARESFGSIARETLAVIRHHCNLTWILNANAFFAGSFALLLAAPKFLSGELSLGAIMQIGSAFTAVLSALNWFAENFIIIAQWRASARRVALLDEALEGLDFDELNAGTRLTIGESPDDGIWFDWVSLMQRNGKVVVDEAELRIAPGERVLLAGESGTGKSTLVRAVAGLWPWGAGEIRLPAGARVAFVPQRPYMPLGTLREALAYPNPAEGLNDEQARTALDEAGLAYMRENLDQKANLDQSLSGGERQRIAFARLFLQKPEIVVMDEATAALDVESETRLLELLFKRLPNATILSVGHRPGLEALHTRKVVLRRDPAGARLNREDARRFKPAWVARPRETVEKSLENLSAIAGGPIRATLKRLKIIS